MKDELEPLTENYDFYIQDGVFQIKINNINLSEKIPSMIEYANDLSYIM